LVHASIDRDDVVVAAARAGDRAAMNELIRRHLPMVYHLVRQALGEDPDVDDVVQDILVRAIRQLPGLRSPVSFRSWLTTIAVRQVGSHLAHEEIVARRLLPLEAAADRADAGAEVEGPALLRAELAGQRQQVERATRWMNTDERTVFSLWCLESLGELSRAELAVGLGTSVAHAGVRLQRMREQLEVSRSVVAALEALPGCDALGDVVAEWDATPSPYWRKRIGRHVRTCPVCTRAAGGLLPADRLLAGLAVLPVPAALGAAALVKALLSITAADRGTAASWLSRGFHVAAAHPVAATVSAGVLAAGIAVPVVERTPVVPPVRAVAVAPHRLSGTTAPPPRPSTGLLTTGKVSLEAAAARGRFVAVSGDYGVLTPVGPASAADARRQATLQAVAGLADSACFSFRGPGGRYLRHSSFRLRLSPADGTVLFRQDATFCARSGFVTGTLSLESVNYPGFFLRDLGDQMWLDKYDGSSASRLDSSFHVRPPLA
jgi:RNA polymerase sigma factor (sigma-70 family)